MNKQKASNTNFSKNPNQNLPSIQQNPYNQTIIINNPNFNINYIQSPPKQHQTIDPKLTHYDNWNLNRNLKEFSQTRQLGFFNSKNKNKNSNTSNPYVALPKNHTQDLRNVSKYKAMNNSRADSKKNKSIPSIIDNHNPSRIDKYQDNLYGSNTTTIKILNNTQASSFRNKKYNYTERNPRQLIPQNQIERQRQTHTNKFLDLLSDKKQDHQKRINIRKNRFSQLQRQDYIQQKIDQPDPFNYAAEQQQSQNELLLNQSQKVDMKKTIKIQTRKINTQYNKTLQIINNSLLSNVDNYLDKQLHQEIAPSKIQYYVSSMRQPQINSLNPEYKSTPINIREDFDFDFEDEKSKKRPKTPFKRKNYYNS